jgi:hypothetical protein
LFKKVYDDWEKSTDAFKKPFHGGSAVPSAFVV